MSKDYLDVFFDVMDKIREHDNEEGVSPQGIPSEGIPPQGIPPEGTREQIVDGVQIGKYHIRVDQNVFDKLLPLLTVYEQVVYMRLYRLSWGFRRNWCEVGYSSLMKSTNTSKNSVIKAIDGLVEKGLVVILRLGDSKSVTKYMVKLPHEALEVERETEVQGVPSQGIPFGGIPPQDKSVPSQGIPPQGTPKPNADGDGVLGGVPSQGIPPQGTITTYNNNNNIIQEGAVDVVDNLVTFFGVTETAAKKWVAEYGPENVEEKMEICRLHMEYQPEKIKNPPGLLAIALREDWGYPEWFLREFAHKAGKELK